jgi:hypothetical protein
MGINKNKNKNDCTVQLVHLGTCIYTLCSVESNFMNGTVNVRGTPERSPVKPHEVV